MYIQHTEKQSVTLEEWQSKRSPWSLPLKFWQFEQLYTSAKDSLLNAQHTWETCALEHLKVGKWELTGKVRRRIAELSRGHSPIGWSSWCRSAQRGEESGCGWHSLHLGGAKRFGGHSCRSGLYELQLSPTTWTETWHRGVAVVDWWSAFQTVKHSHRAWLPLNLPEIASLHT